MFQLPKLPYSFDALSPQLSAETLRVHYKGHHQTYVNHLNSLVERDGRFAGHSLLSIMRAAEGELLENSAQAWNHSFYWFCMTPTQSRPDSFFDLSLRANFNSLADFKEEFVKKGCTLFGAGWLWLVIEKSGKLSLEVTQNAGNPLLEGRSPILVCDLWEHAYYLDYKNGRKAYLEAFCDLINWDYVGAIFKNRSVPNMSNLMGCEAPDV